MVDNTLAKDDLAALEQRFRDTSPKSLACFEQGQSVLPGVAKGAYFYKPYPLTMERGEGCYLFDVDGRRFLDFANHHTAQILGHGHPAILDAVRRQMSRGIALGNPVGIETDLAAEMCRRVPSLDKVRFCNSGTEATLHAIRLARGFSGRSRIAKFEGGYHGSHDVVEISVAPPVEKTGSSSSPLSVPTAGGISPHAAGEVVVLPFDNEEAVQRLVEEHRDQLACVIFDTKSETLSSRKKFVHAVREITRKNDVLLILDEIVTFRVGRGGYQEICGIQPDLTTFGKIIGGGFPVGAFGGRADIMDLFDNTGEPTGFSQSGTFSAHPITMAAGLASMSQLTPDVFARLDDLGNRLRSGINGVFQRKNQAGQAVGIGSLFSIHFTDEPLTNYRAYARSDKTRIHPVFLSLLEQGFFLSHSLTMNALSLPIKATDVDGLIESFERAISRH